MRNILKELPEFYLNNGFDQQSMKDREFYKKILSGFAKQRDTQMRAKHAQRIQSFQRLYKQLISAAAGSQKPSVILRGLCERAAVLNREDRITGNALIQIVFEIINQVKRGMSHSQVQSLIDNLVAAHLGMPEVEASRFYEKKTRPVPPDVYTKLMNFVSEYGEDI
jgi:hypothetical protein